MINNAPKGYAPAYGMRLCVTRGGTAMFKSDRTVDTEAAYASAEMTRAMTDSTRWPGLRPSLRTPLAEG
jgi:hypothetical protein